MHTPLTEEQREALVVLSGECSELIKACCKAMQHGLTPVDESVDPPKAYDNLADIAQEANDVSASIVLVNAVFGADMIDDGLMLAKIMRLKPYLHHINLERLCLIQI